MLFEKKKLVTLGILYMLTRRVFVDHDEDNNERDDDSDGNQNSGDHVFRRRRRVLVDERLQLLLGGDHAHDVLGAHVEKV